MTPSRRAPGDLVSARGRDWVVQPGDADGLVIAQPLDGDREFITALFPGEIEDPGFGRPAAVPGEVGDFASAGLLRTALRIAATHGAGPFRSLASIAVQPRQYQLVPLMMALRMDTVRLLIGDDVGIGKTVEAALIAKELLEQGSATNMAVLCSPALAEQWQSELREKFGMEAELVLPSTAARLQKGVEQNQTLFERYPCTVVSTDFIKQPDRREAFRRTCPDLLIVDEAHSCVGTGGGHQQRYELLSALAQDPDRHLILVTATPHSGDADAFARLIGLLDPALQALDPALPAHRDRLARHFVQRRRRDIKRYLDEDTPFPSDRKLREVPYQLDTEYARFVTDVLAYAREQVRRPDGALQQRLTWWSVLALLRCVLSSPAAAAETLKVRAALTAARTEEEADRIGRAAVNEIVDDEAADGLDAVPGSLLDSSEGTSGGRKLKEFAERAATLEGAEHDSKLRTLVDEVKGLLVDGYDPIVFCRYIPTAEYVAEHLADALGRSAHVEAVTGKLHSDARQARIDELTAKRGRHVLVATDCLSEGVNLQDHFGAVLHYDLSWNPTRHEQREGRVDRFGQSRENVRAVTLYDTDTGVDGLVLDVLIRKHRDIAHQVGVVVPIPDGGDGVLRALSRSLLLRNRGDDEQLTFDFSTDELFSQARERLHKEWDSAADRESKVLTKFAHSGLRPDEVQAELDALRQSLGDAGDIAEFTRETLKALGSAVRPDPRSTGFTAPAGPLPRGLRHALGIYEDAAQAAGPGAAQAPARTAAKGKGKGKGSRGAAAPHELVFHQDLPVPAGEHALFRTDPAVRAVARYVLDSALDQNLSENDRPARRLGVIRTTDVDHRTVLLLVRYRFRLTLPSPRRTGRTKGEPRELVAEDAQLLAWRTAPEGTREWLTDEQTAALLAAAPDRNTIPSMRDQQIVRALDELDEVRDQLESHGHDVARRLEAAHQRVREAAGERGRARGAAAARGITAEPAGEPDLLGVYVYVKRPGGSR